MIPFPFNENRFSFFFVADHLLVGQLCTNAKSDRRLLSCLKVTECSTGEIGDAPLHMLWFFSDETNFCQDQVHNGQNHCWIATNNRDVPRVMKTKFPAMVVVFSVVSSQGHIMPPHIFEVGLKVNTKVYLYVLKSVVIPWCNQLKGERTWVWQQDSAPGHKSKETQAWLQKECYDFVPFSHWPSSSPDLNLLDFFVWSYVENITNMTSHNTKASLITAIHWVFAELPPALIEKACFQFRIRIEAVIEADGG